MPEVLNFLHKLNKVEGHTQSYMFWCPGCKTIHTINDTWEISGTDDKPTVAPSVKCWSEYRKYCCHLFLREGKIQYLNDCTHDLKGKIVDCKRFKKVEWNDEDNGKHKAYEAIEE